MGDRRAVFYAVHPRTKPRNEEMATLVFDLMALRSCAAVRYGSGLVTADFGERLI